MKSRLTFYLVIIAIIFTATLSRFLGNSDYILAQSQDLAYKFIYCPYNRPPFTNTNYPYRYIYKGYPTIRYPYLYKYPLPKQYPCPCSTPAILPLLDD